MHIDVNNAYLSWTAVDMLHNGSKVDIRNRYAIIAGDEATRHGIVLAKSNLCKKRGVVTAETIYTARKKCPYLEVYPPQFKIYKKYSDRMYSYLCNYTNIIERYSIDECFLDVSDGYAKYGSPLKLAYKIKNDIRDNFGFTVNVGIGNNKLLAKMASDFSKPDKVHTLYLDEIKEKMWPLNVNQLFMIGKASSKKLHELGINTIRELANSKQEYLTKHFKSMGKMMWEYANGIDNSSVENERGKAKSISTSMVLPYDYTNTNLIKNELKRLASETGRRLRKQKMYTPNVGIWIKYHDFSKISKQVSFNNLINTDNDIYNYAVNLFDKMYDADGDKKVRSLCVFVSNITDEYKVQLSLLENVDEKEKAIDKQLKDTLLNIKNKYGDNSITYADKIKK